MKWLVSQWHASMCWTSGQSVYLKFLFNFFFLLIIATHIDSHFGKLEGMCLLHYEVKIFTHTIQSNIAPRRPQEDRENLG